MVNTINPADCDRTTVYTGECRNFQDTEWITFNSGRRRSPNARDGNTWLIDVAHGSFWMRDDQVRNLVRLVPARPVTRQDLPDDPDDRWETFRSRFKEFDGYRSEAHQHSLWTVFRSGIQYAETRMLDHLNASGGVPVSREDAALADRLERQAASIARLQGELATAERDRSRWRRAHGIVEQERYQARAELAEVQVERRAVRRRDAALRAVLDACSTYEKTQAIYGIEMGQREIIRVVRAEISAALGEES